MTNKKRGASCITTHLLSFDAIYILFPKLKPFLYKQFRPFPQLFSLLVMSESF